jgi:hypothetical protein
MDLKPMDFKRMSIIELLARLCITHTPSDTGRAWFKETTTAEERFRLRTMSFEDLINTLGKRGEVDFAVVRAAVELERRAWDAGYKTMTEYVLVKMSEARAQTAKEAMAQMAQKAKDEAV